MHGIVGISAEQEAKMWGWEVKLLKERSGETSTKSVVLAQVISSCGRNNKWVLNHPEYYSDNKNE